MFLLYLLLVETLKQETRLKPRRLERMLKLSSLVNPRKCVIQIWRCSTQERCADMKQIQKNVNHQSQYRRLGARRRNTSFPCVWKHLGNANNKKRKNGLIKGIINFPLLLILCPYMMVLIPMMMMALVLTVVTFEFLLPHLKKTLMILMIIGQTLFLVILIMKQIQNLVCLLQFLSMHLVLLIKCRELQWKRMNRWFQERISPTMVIKVII